MLYDNYVPYLIYTDMTDNILDRRGEELEGRGGLGLESLFYLLQQNVLSDRTNSDVRFSPTRSFSTTTTTITTTTTTTTNRLSVPWDIPQLATLPSSQQPQLWLPLPSQTRRMRTAHPVLYGPTRPPATLPQNTVACLWHDGQKWPRSS